MFSSHLGHVFVAEPLTLQFLPFQLTTPATTPPPGISTIKQAHQSAEWARRLSPGMKVVLCFSQIKKKKE